MIRDGKSRSLWSASPSHESSESGGMSSRKVGSAVCAAFQAAMVVGSVASRDAAKWANRGEGRSST